MEEMWITKKVLLYIEDNLDKALTLEEIAAEFQYSRFYVARKFRESTGVTLHKYIQGRRLDEAARKLAETRQPIAQIAFEAGYGSQQAFTQAFRPGSTDRRECLCQGRAESGWLGAGGALAVFMWCVLLSLQGGGWRHEFYTLCGGADRQRGEKL